MNAPEATRRPATRPSAPAGRPPPHDTAAEEAVLGACLFAQDAIDQALDHSLHPDDFYSPAHGHIWHAITAANAQGEPVDPVTIAARLAGEQLLDSIGGPGTLLRLQAATPATRNAGRYARIVIDTARRRRIIAAAADITFNAYEPATSDVDQLADQAEATLAQATARRNTQRAILIGDTARDWWQRITSPDRTPALPTGWIDLDRLLGGGLRAGQLIVVAARPGVGKSLWGTNVAAHAAGRLGRTTLLCSLEMSHDEVDSRIVSRHAELSHELIRKGAIGPADHPRIEATLAQLDDWPLIVQDQPDLSVAALTSLARRVPNLSLVIVDYLQLMTPSDAARQERSREREVADISTGLKLLARRLQVPVVALAQLNRDLEQRANKRPILADLRESGKIENDADIVIALYRDELYNPKSPDKGVMEQIVLKQRAGPLGTVETAFLGDHSTIANLAQPLGAP